MPLAPGGARGNHASYRQQRDAGQYGEVAAELVPGDQVSVPQNPVQGETGPGGQILGFPASCT